MALGVAIKEHPEQIWTPAFKTNILKATGQLAVADRVSEVQSGLIHCKVENILHAVNFTSLVPNLKSWVYMHTLFSYHHSLLYTNTLAPGCLCEEEEEKHLNNHHNINSIYTSLILNRTLEDSQELN